MTEVTNVEIPNIERDSSVLLANTSADIAINLAILVAYATRNKNLTRRQVQDHQQHTS